MTNQNEEIMNSLKDSGGNLMYDKVYELVDKYVDLKDNARRVYTTVTNNILNSPEYSSEYVISVYESIQRHMIDRITARDDMLSIISPEDTGLEQFIYEYFGDI